MSDIAQRDENHVTTLLAVSSVDLTSTVTLYADPVTHRLLVQSTGGGSGNPGGLNTQLQYNNAGSFGGITGATTDGTLVSLNGAHLLNPTINGAGAGLATLAYQNTPVSVTITVPATTGTLALTSQLTSGTVTAVAVATTNGFSGTSDGNAGTPTLTLATSVTGLLKGNGTALSAATVNVDYQAPITLTTTGTSGAATLISNTLNIPQYAGGVTSVTNSDSSLTITPTTGAVVAILNLANPNVFTAVQTVNKTALATTTVDGLVLENTTAAANNAQQITPSLHFTSFGWGTTAPSSQAVDFRINSLPLQGNVPTGSLQFMSSVAGGAYGTILTITTSGVVSGSTFLATPAATTTAFGATSTPLTSNIAVLSTGFNTTTTAGTLFGGGLTIGYRAVLVNGITTATPATTVPYAGLIVGSGAVTIPSSGTTSLFANMVINPLTVNTGAGTITATASLYINGAASAVTGAASNFALLVGSGNSQFNGNLTLGTAGNKLNITTGSNASAGTGTLVGGTVTISTTAVTASSLIFLTDTSTSTTNVGNLTVSAKTAGTSFVVTSTIAIDTSTFNWFIIN